MPLNYDSTNLDISNKLVCYPFTATYLSSVLGISHVVKVFDVAKYIFAFGIMCCLEPCLTNYFNFTPRFRSCIESHGAELRFVKLVVYTKE